METEELAELLARGHETQRVELKGPGRSDDKGFLAKVVRAMLGLTNLRDGGSIVIGVDDRGDPIGLTDVDEVTWNHDDVTARVAEYADPSVVFTIEHHRFQGERVVVIVVEEFTDIPVLCKKEYSGELIRGACYVRSRRQPQTVPVPTQEDMRDLLDLAVEKRLRRYLATAQRAGAVVVRAPEDTPAEPALAEGTAGTGDTGAGTMDDEADDEAYRRQLGDLA